MKIRQCLLTQMTSQRRVVTQLTRLTREFAMASGPPVIEELVPRLASSDPSIRNGAALNLRDLAESGVSVPVEPFLSAISDPANHDNRGTLVYAIQMLDCTGYFAQIFDLTLHGNFECQNHALAILDEQAMRLTPEMLREAGEKLSVFIPSGNMTGEDAEALRAELVEILSRLGEEVEPDPPDPG
jgi:hypothetical protein